MHSMLLEHMLLNPHAVQVIACVGEHCDVCVCVCVLVFYAVITTSTC